ncbi:MAG: hemerythrin domain-containing protein [Planctomycetota bacterium]
MSAPFPTAQLNQEHARILRLLDALEALVAAAAAAPHDAPLEDLAAAIAALRDYADGAHHGKEEELLFPALERSGLPRHGGPVGCMLREHDEGRALIADMSDALADLEAGDGGRAAALASAALGYTHLLRLHIQKEDTVLFPLAEQLLGEELKLELLRGFSAIDDDRGAADLARAIDELCARWDPSPAR